MMVFLYQSGAEPRKLREKAMGSDLSIGFLFSRERGKVYAIVCIAETSTA